MTIERGFVPRRNRRFPPKYPFGIYFSRYPGSLLITYLVPVTLFFITVGYARDEAEHVIPRYTPGLRLRPLPPDPQWFPFLRNYARYPRTHGIRSLISRWLYEAGDAWLQEVWVVKLSECRTEVLTVFRLVGPESFLESSALDRKPYLYLFGVLSHRAAFRPTASLRRRVEPYSGHFFRMRRLLTRERARCSTSLFKRYCVLGAVSSHLPTWCSRLSH